MRIAKITLVLLAALAAACATMPRLDPPTVERVEVRLDRIEGPAAWFGISLDLANPNSVGVTLDSLDVGLAIEDEVVATASLSAPIELRANGRTTAELTAQTRMDAILRAVAASMSRGIANPGEAPALRYAIQAGGTLRGGQQIAFSRRGELRLPDRR